MRSDLSRYDKRSLIADSVKGILAGGLFAAFNVMGYQLVMDSAIEGHIDHLTVEAREMYVNFPLVSLLLALTAIALYVSRGWHRTTTIYYISFLVSMFAIGSVFYFVPILVVGAYYLKNAIF